MLAVRIDHDGRYLSMTVATAVDQHLVISYEEATALYVGLTSMLRTFHQQLDRVTAYEQCKSDEEREKLQARFLSEDKAVLGAR